MAYMMRQAYQKVIREMDRVGQVNRAETRYLYLYEHKIASKHHEFPLQDVFDISFKKMLHDEAMLFLHTNHGVYSYHVLSSPTTFIEKCKEYINK